MRLPRAILPLLLVACTRDNEVHISLGAANKTPIGYRCRDSTGMLLDRRAVDSQNRVMKVSIVTDFVALNGFPSCRANDLLDYCTSHPCNTIPQARSCIELQAPFGLLDSPSVVMGQILDQLPGRVVATDAPDEPLLVRVTATAQPCSALAGAAPFDANLVTGCSFSCPVLLDQVTGDVQLDLPTFTDFCADGVLACAGAVLR